ncbi:PilT protein domain-containing protein [Bifidobacterium italicum]|uniref:PilT protein domain-containing protein n=1 Tax=Bifidobacterium italicum TaxID=1960968 RepID=A0A2A2ELR4_9BIFI|nr:PIN domain-containing protein [Bifidobacterium italicum]PAU69922.1 PilT protein domain-containing protein [Bifidobacterium italicum]
MPNAPRLLLDTNILLDYVVPDRPHSEAAATLVQLAAHGHARICVTPGSLKDLYYIAGKSIGELLTRQYIEAFLDLFVVLTVDQELCALAIRSDEPDFEDGLVRAAAEVHHIDFIITRDRAAFQRSTVRSMSSDEYVRLFAR